MGHRHEIRVRYGETDKMGVVHHSVYPLYFEEARTELMRSLGLPYSEFERGGYLLPLTEIGIRFFLGPRYDDVLVLEAWVSQLTRVRLRLSYRMHRKGDGVLLAEGHTGHACTNQELRPRRFPEYAVRVFEQALEAPAEDPAPSARPNPPGGSST